MKQYITDDGYRHPKTPGVNGRVEVAEDHVALYDENDEELVYWDQQEWVEDPSLLPSIANAINLLHTRGPQAVRERIDK